MSTSVPVPDIRQPSVTVHQPKPRNKARTAKRRQKATGANKDTKARKPPGPATRPETKTAKVLHLLKRSGGATLNDLMQATDWQAHSVRGFLSGTLRKKMGLALTSTNREDGARTYSLPS